MADWKKFDRGPWDFTPDGYKNYYNEGESISSVASPVWTMIDQFGTEKISDVHQPHCGYWPDLSYQAAPSGNYEDYVWLTCDCLGLIWQSNTNLGLVNGPEAIDGGEPGLSQNAADENFVYVVSGTGYTVYKVSKSTLAVVDSKAISGYSTYAVAVDENYVYVNAHKTYPSVTEVFYVLSKDLDTIVAQYSDLDSYWPSTNNVKALAVDDVYVYVGISNPIPANQREVQKRLKSDFTFVDRITSIVSHGLAVDETYLYVTTGSVLYKYLKSDLSLVDSVDLSAYRTYSSGTLEYIAVNDDYLYTVFNNSSVTVARTDYFLKIDKGTLTVVNTSTAYTHLTGISIAGPYQGV